MPRSLVLLMLLQYGAGGALYPFLAPYLAARGLSVEEIGWLALAGAASSTALPFVWGAIADRLLPVNRLITLMHLMAAGVLLYWSQLESVAGIIFLFMIYTGLQQPTNSLVNSLSYHNLDEPARQFGSLRLWGSVGWMLPSLPITLWLMGRHDQSLGFVVALTAAVQVSIFLLAPVWPHTPPAARTAGDGVFLRDVRALVRSPGFLLFLFVTFTTLASFSIMFYFSSLALERAGVPRAWLGPVQSAGVALEIPLFLALPWFLARFGYRVVLALGCLSGVLRHLTFALSSDPYLLGVASMLIAPCVVFFLIGGSLAVNAVAQRSVRSTAQSLFALVGAGLGAVCGLLGTALLSEEDSLVRPFMLASALALAGLVSLGFVRFQA